jgi:hypothetical protein
LSSYTFGVLVSFYSCKFRPFRNISLSFYCFLSIVCSPCHPVTIQLSECPIVLKIPLFSMPSSHDLLIRMFHCLFIVLKIPLFSMPSSHDPVIRMFHCLFIVLKFPLFFLPSSHDPVIRMFHCLFIVLNISLFSMPSSHDLSPVYTTLIFGTAL